MPAGLGVKPRSQFQVKDTEVKTQIPKRSRNAGIEVRLPAQDQEHLNQCNRRAGRTEKKH